MPHTCLLIGHGNIGKALVKELALVGHKVSFILEADGLYRGGNKIAEAKDYAKHLKDIDFAFLAIPTTKDGKLALGFIETLAKKGIPVVTCEKGALANHHQKLAPLIKKELLKTSATVGGGTRMLAYLKERNSHKITEIHGALNGTLNFVFDEIAKGSTLEKACTQAVKNGFTEPGATLPADIVNAEMGDVLFKLVILFNLSGLSKKTLRASDLKLQPLLPADLKKIVKDGLRCMVSITKTAPKNLVGGFHTNIGEWHLSMGFQKPEGNWMPSGVTSALLIKEGESAYLIQGPGAGAEPTAASMVRDTLAIIGKY